MDHLADSAAAARAALGRRRERAHMVAVLGGLLSRLRSGHRALRGDWATAIVLMYSLMLSLPLIFVHVFYFDWFNHLWIAQYVADRLGSEHAFPAFVSVDNGIGNPIFLFYGSSLYALTSPFVYALGANVGVRLAVFLAFLLPNLAILRLIRHALGDRGTSVAATIVLSTSLYNLTNIYTRGAVTEFFAYQLLIFSIAIFFDAQAFPQRDRPARLLVGITAAGLGLLAHPPTAYLCVIFLSIPFAAYTILSRRSFRLDRRAATAVSVGFLVAVIPLSLWLRFVLADASSTGFGSSDLSSFTFFPFSIDHWLARILPWPTDFRVEIEGFGLVSTPFLSAPINAAGLLLLAGLIVTKIRTCAFDRSILLFTTMVVIVVVMSLLLSLPFGPLEQAKSPDGSPIFGMFHTIATSWRTLILGRVQFGYRLVNIVNASIVFGFFALALNWRGDAGKGEALSERVNWQRLALAAAALSLAVAAAKLAEVYREYELLPAIGAKQTAMEATGNERSSTKGIYAWVSQSNLNNLRTALDKTNVAPATEYGFASYAMPSLFPKYLEKTQFPLQEVVLEPLNSQHAAGTVHCSTACALSTAIFPSPYFRIDVNGAAVSLPLLRTLKERVVVLVPQAGDYSVTVHLGTWETTAFGYAVGALAVTFWLSGLMAIGQSPRMTRLSPSAKVGDDGTRSRPGRSRGA